MKSFVYILSITLFIISCNTSQEKVDYKKLYKTNHLTDYELFLNKYPNSKKYAKVLQDYERLLNFDPSDPNFSFMLHGLGTRRNAIEIFIIKDSLPCINGSLCNSNEFIERYSNFLEYSWENRTPPAQECLILDDNYFCYTRGCFIIYYNSIEASDTIQKMAIQCKKIIDNYKDSLLKKWSETPVNELSKHPKLLIDSLFSNRIMFLNYMDNSICYSKPLMPPYQYNLEYEFNSTNIDNLIGESNTINN